MQADSAPAPAIQAGALDGCRCRLADDGLCHARLTGHGVGCEEVDRVGAVRVRDGRTYDELAVLARSRRVGSNNDAVVADAPVPDLACDIRLDLRSDLDPLLVVACLQLHA